MAPRKARNPYGSDAVRSAVDVFLVTPDDDVDNPNVTRAVSFAVAGDMAIVTLDGTSITIPGLAAGIIHPIACRRILATGTTATGIVGYL